MPASPENPAYDINSPELWDLIGAGTQSASGIRVTPQKSLMIAAVWQGVSMIAGDIAKLPLDVYRRTDNEGREAAKEHPAWWVVRKQANDEMHANRFWRVMMVRAVLWGNAFAIIERNGRQDAVGLHPLEPDRTALERINGKLYCVTESNHLDGSPVLRPIPYQDVLHISGISLDGTLGAMMVKLARDAFGLALSRQGFASKFFRHGVRSGGILELPLGTSQQFQRNVEEGFKKHHEGEENWFKTVILRDGVKFHMTSFNAQEAQMNETSNELVREVARYLSMPPSRLGVDGSTSYNSKSEDNAVYLDTTLSPWLQDIANECDSKLLSKEQRNNDTHFFEHNTRALLSMDYKTRVETGSIATKARMLTVNEWRKAENLPPVEWGDEPFEENPAFAGGADKGDNAPPRGPAERMSVAAKKAIIKLAESARRNTKDGKTYCDWIDRRVKTTDDSHVNAFVEELRQCAMQPISELENAVNAACEKHEALL